MGEPSMPKPETTTPQYISMLRIASAVAPMSILPHSWKPATMTTALRRCAEAGAGADHHENEHQQEEQEQEEEQEEEQQQGQHAHSLVQRPSAQHCSVLTSISCFSAVFLPR